MSKPIQIIGTPVSPFVRKILAALALKGIEFEIDPIIAFYTDERFLKFNPLRRIPVLIDGDAVLADSSVIAAYLDEKFPAPPLLPASPADRAQARWLEEFADTRMADVFLWRCFNAVIIRPGVFGEERDIDLYRETLAGPVVEIMDYLEALAPKDGFLFGSIGLGDIAVAVMFRNMRYARWTPDETRWPNSAAWIARAEADPALALSTAWADALIPVRPPEQRAKLIDLGAPVMEETLFVDAAPSRGPMATV